ncbi:unnamed protein product, partial [Discosporangium mesarthrocarpum]
MSESARRLLASVKQGLIRGAQRWGKTESEDELQPLASASVLPEQGSFNDRSASQPEKGALLDKSSSVERTLSANEILGACSAEGMAESHNGVETRRAINRCVPLPKFLSWAWRQGERTEVYDQDKDEEEWAILLASTFIEDAMGYRDPDYRTDDKSMGYYRFRQSRGWQTCSFLAVLVYMAACFVGPSPFTVVGTASSVETMGSLAGDSSSSE